MATADQLARMVQVDHTNAVAALENATVKKSTGDLDDRFSALTQRTLTAWATAFGAVGAAATAGAALRRIIAAVRAAVTRLLDGLGPRASAALDDAVTQAVLLGAQQGTQFLRAASGRQYGTPASRASRAVRDEAALIDAAVTERRGHSLSLIHPDRVRSWHDLLAGIGTARGAVAAVRSQIAWSVGRAVNEGLSAVIRASSAGRLWIAEADACVRCLAYAGLVATGDDPFPGGLSWDPRQRTVGAPGIVGPPEHPYCRCRTVPWLDRWDGTGTPFPTALRREAQRSIAYGRAGSGESTAARLRAARELLRTEDDLLPAVEEVARRALSAGRFATAA